MPTVTGAAQYRKFKQGLDPEISTQTNYNGHVLKTLYYGATKYEPDGTELYMVI